MRTNIVLDEDLMREAQKLTALPTKKAVVDEALIVDCWIASFCIERGFPLLHNDRDFDPLRT